MIRPLEFRVWNDLFMCYQPMDPAYPAEYGLIIDNTCDGFYVEQYTGVKDKDGNKIFEGDIITDTQEPNKGFYEVIFDNGCFCYFTNGMRMLLVGNIRVVGNIHENPELLNTNNSTRDNLSRPEMSQVKEEE